MDAEGFHEHVPCPRCGSENTVSFHYIEGFDELECPACGYRSDADEIAALTRFQGGLLERDDRPEEERPPIPIRTMKA